MAKHLTEMEKAVAEATLRANAEKLRIMRGRAKLIAQDAEDHAVEKSQLFSVRRAALERSEAEAVTKSMHAEAQRLLANKPKAYGDNP